MTVGEKIKKYRIEAELTQKKLGELSGTSERTIQNYELGKRQPRMEQLQKIATALEITLYDFVEIEGLPRNKEEAVYWKRSLLLELYDKLNNAGCNKAIETLEDLTFISKYTEPDVDPPILNAAHVPKDVEVTEEDRPHDEGIEEDFKKLDD